MLTTEIWLLYVMIALMALFFVVSMLLTYIGPVNVCSVVSMAISALLSFKISDIFIDGTLTKTENLVVGSEIVKNTEVIRNSAASGVFELLAIVFVVLTLLQVYQFIKETRVEEALD
jgi:hypothetical protein